MPDTGEALEVWRIKPKKFGSSVASIISRYFKSIIELFTPHLSPAAFKIARHVPVGTSFEPW
jgi:hypothetical protein